MLSFSDFVQGYIEIEVLKLFCKSVYLQRIPFFMQDCLILYCAFVTYGKKKKSVDPRTYCFFSFLLFLLTL